MHTATPEGPGNRPLDPTTEAARAAHASGLCIVPPAEDGTKRPLPDASGEWDRFKTTRPTDDELNGWYPGRSGIGVIAGIVSGRLDVWDFDTREAFEAFVAASVQAGLADVVERIDGGYRDDTPSGGARWLVRYPKDIERKPGGRIVLARRPGLEGEPKIKTLIELPAFNVIAPSNGSVHSSGEPYVHVSGGFDSVASYTAGERDALMQLARTFDEMPRVEARDPIRERGSGETRPGDIWATRTSWSDILNPFGWTNVFTRGDTTHWRRPGKRFGISATTNHGGSNLFYCFSTSTEFEADVSYTKFGAWTLLEHRGDFTAAAKALVEQGYGDSDEPWNPFGDTSVHANGTAAISSDQQPEETPPLLPRLPDEFWSARPVLEHIRQAAHSRNRSADATLYAVLARVAAFRWAVATVDTGIGSPASLNFYGAFVDPSGAGKSSPVRIARDLIEAPPDYDIADPLPLGSGEGLAEAFMGWIARPTEDGKKKEKVRAQTRFHAFVYADEGQSLVRQLERSGSTIGEALRRGWNGETLGQFNATQERTRIVVDYALSVIIGFQPSTILPLLNDAGAGTPQRFVFASCVDPSVPDEPPEWPGPIDLNIYGTFYSYSIDEEICRQLRTEDTARVRGQVKRSELDSHEPLHRIKLAGLLTTLDGRTHIDSEDWRLAGLIWETSCAVRDQVAEYGRRLERSAKAEKVREHVQRAVAADAAVSAHERAVRRVAGVITRRVQKLGTCQRRDITQALDSKDRPLRDQALDYAISEGWITETDDGFTASEDV